MASLTRNPRGQLRTPGVRTAPTGPRPRITRAPPPGRTWRHAQTRARQGRRCREIHRKPARGQRPWKPHPTRPSARTKEERHPAGTTATTTPSMPSWTPAGMTPGRSQHRRCHASTRSRNANRRTIRSHGATTSAPPARLHHPGADCRYGRGADDRERRGGPDYGRAQSPR